MYEVVVWMTAILAVLLAMDYVRRAWIRETNPTPATWILMMVVMGLSYWMYWKSPEKSWGANIGLTSGVINVAIILAGVIATRIHLGTLKETVFDTVQKWCLVGGAAVAVFWFFTDRPLLSYVLVQCIAVIAYIATAQRLWKAKRSTEPLVLWVGMCIGSLCALYPAWVKQDPFAWIYLTRAIPSTILMVYLITRIKKKMRAVDELATI